MMKKNASKMFMLLGLIYFLACTSTLHAAEYHVSVKGNDVNEGSQNSPFKTIQHAADLAQPGDTITVHEGTYRERINPPRGGISDTQRITYQAAPGETVVIKGSEVATGWEKVKGDTWKVMLPNSFFGNFNPYSDFIHGDWFDAKGRTHHTGAVYLDGVWLTEAKNRRDVLEPVETTPLWFGTVGHDETTIWAQFKGVDPNEQLVEINVRQTVFYPEETGRNYITVRGFTLCHAATPWAPPTAEQIGLIGTHWSKGWIIENNTISHSTCTGVALGKHGDKYDNTSADSAEGYVKTIERAIEHGWSKENIGHHIVRNNTIAHCEQAGIVGSLGAIYSQITGNHIHHIFTRRLFHGCEQAGIKIHAAIDGLIKNNRVHNTGRGIWIDWMAQGTRITGNLCYDNNREDLYAEVNHGPYLVDNNLFLSGRSVWDMSEGGAYVHNLMTGKIDNWYDMGRLTPYMQAHSTKIAGLAITQGGDNRFFNNIFVGQGKPDEPGEAVTDPQKSITGFGLWVYDARNSTLYTGGNVYYNGARPYNKESAPLVVKGVDPAPRLTEKEEGVYLELTLGQVMQESGAQVVTAELLGKATVPGLPFETPNGSPLRISTEYFGNKRNEANPFPGPFEDPGVGRVKLRVWPRK